MNLESLKNALPGYAKDLKLNLSSVLTPGGAPGLTEQQIAGVALASAIASRNTELSRHVETIVRAHADNATIEGAKAAAAIMGMNNVYYRFTHLVEDDNYTQMPARLRMTVIGRPNTEKTDFELYSLAVSAINGCGGCITGHERELRTHGVSREAIQSAVRIASVIHAVAATLEYEREAA